VNVSVTVTAQSNWYPSGGEKRALGYIEWRLACIRVWVAYQEWTRTMRADAVLANAMYEAALDREDAAATAYARLMKRAGGSTGRPGHSRSAEEANHAAREEGGC
jgi:hypothetical protein